MDVPPVITPRVSRKNAIAIERAILSVSPIVIERLFKAHHYRKVDAKTSRPESAYLFG